MDGVRVMSKSDRTKYQKFLSAVPIAGDPAVAHGYATFLHYGRGNPNPPPARVLFSSLTHSPLSIHPSPPRHRRPSGFSMDNTASLLRSLSDLTEERGVAMPDPKVPRFALDATERLRDICAVELYHRLQARWKGRGAAGPGGARR